MQNIRSIRWADGNDAQTIAHELTAFLGDAERSLHIAIYDFRLADPECEAVIGALRAAAARGVEVMVAYDHTRSPEATALGKTILGNDPAPRGTREFIQRELPPSSGVQTKAIAGAHLMHSKYIIRDIGGPRATVWTGSANFTNDAWSRQENNVLQIRSAALAQAYQFDFAELWTAGDIRGTGSHDYSAIRIEARAKSGAAASTVAEIAFAPGTSAAVASLFVDAIQDADPQEHIQIASMVLSSGPILGALSDHLTRGGSVGGVYDATQMLAVEQSWRRGAYPSPKLALWNQIKPRLARKTSIPASPTGVHDFMHNKVLVTSRVVVTGSFNLSENAESNAENAIAIHDAELAGEYGEYVGELEQRYR